MVACKEDSYQAKTVQVLRYRLEHFDCINSKLPYELVHHHKMLKLKSVKLNQGFKLDQFCDVSAIESLAEKMGKTVTNVEKLGK